ncbi:MAG: Gx transporter family protein [Lachnospiraceae bacterium]|nr:Gx transporter family protein [Lachnospiraceae bacterium]
MMRYRTDKIAYTAMFTAVSLALYTLEGSLPVLIPVPGAKLGLSNIVIMFLVYKGMRKEAFLTLIMKLVLSVLIAGQVVSLVYGLFGGILAYFAMCLVNFISVGEDPFLLTNVGRGYNKINSVGVQSPTEINAPRGCARIRKGNLSACADRIRRASLAVRDLKYKKRGTVICGVFSAMMHNIGQCIAAWLMGFRGLILYMPYLMVIGAATGVFTGLICRYMLMKIRTVR